MQAPDTVIADAVYVLSSPRLYHLVRRDIQEMLAALVRLPQFHIQNSWSALQALDLYTTIGLDFEDALIIASMEQQCPHIPYSYDADFDGVQGLLDESLNPSLYRFNAKAASTISSTQTARMIPFYRQ